GEVGMMSGDPNSGVAAGWYIMLWRMPTGLFQYADLRDTGPYTSREEAVAHACDECHDADVIVRLWYADRRPFPQLDWNAGERLMTERHASPKSDTTRR